MVGFSCALVLDLLSYIFKDHKAWKDVPQWDWKARILLAIVWPLGILIFLYSFCNKYFE